MRSAPRRTRFRLGNCPQADSRRKLNHVYAKKKLISGTQVEVKSDTRLFIPSIKKTPSILRTLGVWSN